MAWKMSMMLEAAEPAVILNCRDLRVDGLSLGRNSTVWLPTERPETSASVALASHSIAATCCALRPGEFVSLVQFFKEPRCMNWHVTSSLSTSSVSSDMCDADWLGDNCCESTRHSDELPTAFTRSTV